MNALLIEDSLAMRNYIGGMLEELGFAVVTGDNGQIGLDLLAEHGRPDVVLVDWNMPIMNGIEFVEAVRNDPTYENLNMLMVTSESELDSVVHALEKGVNEYIIKPFTEEDLAEKLRMVGVLQN